MTVRAAIVGPTGYSGQCLIEILLNHPQAEVTYLASHRDELPLITDLFPQLLGRIDSVVGQCKPIDPDAIAKEADVAFLALPHRASMTYTPQLLDAGLTVIDLSGDYRLKDVAVYEKYYQVEHTDVERIQEAVYGLPELFRDQIPGAKLICNPGCYPTAAAIAIAPFVKAGLVNRDSIVINAASGVSGAGNKPSLNCHFPEMNESFYAYKKIGCHQHQPEIKQTLELACGDGDVNVLFVPHLLPLDRGILETIYLDPAVEGLTQEKVDAVLKDAYDDEPFVRVREALPNVKHVRGTNFCDVTAKLAGPGDVAGAQKIVVFAAIDNLVKGASGQAIQNMNILFGLDETAGLL